MYIRSILLGFILAFFLFVLAIYWQMGSFIYPESQGIYNTYKNKSGLVKLMSSPKILVISGSNSYMGISCEQIYQETNVPCFNGGTHAGLDIEYLLDRSKQWLNSQDIVLLPLEYRHYSSNGPNLLLIDYVLSGDPEYLLKTDLINKLKIISGVSWDRLRRGIEAKFSQAQDKMIIPNDMFFNNVNKYGDHIGNKKGTITLEQKQKISQTQPTKLMLNYLKNTQGMKSIQKFVYYCRQNQIKVIATWPNLLWFDVYDKYGQEAIQSIRDFYNTLQVPVLGEPDFFRDKELFYDTEYHLNDIQCQN